MNRRVLAGAAAAIIAITGAGAVVVYARAADQRALEGQRAVTAYVVREQVPAGTTAGKAVAEGLIVQELIARKAVPDDVLTSTRGGYDQLVATTALQPGTIVLRPQFAARAATEGQLSIPEGKFAVSVALDDPSHVGPFISVGSHVAIFDTFNVQEMDTKDETPAGDHLQDRHEYTRATRLLLPDVEVLAVGATTTAATSADLADAEEDAVEPVAMQTADARILVTVAVTQAQAEKIVHVARTGTMTLALVGPEAAATPGAGTDDRRLFKVAAK
jgi:pilus assembly protein CpaB